MCVLFVEYIAMCVCECNEAGGIQVSLTCRVHVALTRHFMCSQCIQAQLPPSYVCVYVW